MISSFLISLAGTLTLTRLWMWSTWASHLWQRLNPSQKRHWYLTPMMPYSSLHSLHITPWYTSTGSGSSSSLKSKMRPFPFFFAYYTSATALIYGLGFSSIFSSFILWYFSLISFFTNSAIVSFNWLATMSEFTEMSSSGITSFPLGS